MKIDILLSTYNGEQFLEELLQSLIDQSYSDWRLLVRDDGSTDNTVEILDAFRKKEQERVIIFKDDQKNLGPKKSFEALLQSSTADYIMFCDQDDVWMKDKVQQTYDKMKTLEQQDPESPVLVFTDLTVVDKNLNVLHPSLWQYTKVKPENINNVYRLLVNNPVVGCTVMINKAAKSVALPFPEKAVMHDWWMALNISRKGKAGFVPAPTIFYRLHEKNNLGVSEATGKYYLNRIFHFPTMLSQNMNAIKMLNSLDFSLSVIKFLGYKFAISFSKIFR
ncbi:MAG: glycosyltransferase family 2 protein [Bacteroidales bacterium]|nr:glycosyltransferase family 2 protein [Bacteroidales bacterium]